VDDDPVILELLERSLTSQEGYDLTTSESAEDALRLLEETKVPFECFLLDIMLPGIDGIELCEAVRQMRLYRTAPIIMITASREPDLMERAFYAGATDFISKPLEGVELSARIISASMLNDSLHRERDARHTLADLTDKMKPRFTAPVDLSTPNVTDFLTLENTLLRMPAGVYTMHLFSLDVLGMRGIYQALSFPKFKRQLETVSETAAQALGDRTWRMAYAGSGRFLGLVMGRERLDREAFVADMDARMADLWEHRLHGTLMPPSVRVRMLSDQRLWTGLTASDMFRARLENMDLLQSIEPQEEENLFARLDDMIRD
ncbi:MAG: response regulator, partial [Henriciella sp.]|uniref:response regulator n=1 Tax=Henriciella sp. TaxID=1968823 RepID=UPI003C76C82C